MSVTLEDCQRANHKVLTLQVMQWISYNHGCPINYTHSTCSHRKAVLRLIDVMHTQDEGARHRIAIIQLFILKTIQSAPQWHHT